MRVRLMICTTVLALGLLGAAPAAAEEGWNLRLAGVWISPDGETRVEQENGQRIQTTLDDSLALGLSVEYGISDRVGVELGYLGGAQSELGLALTLPGGPMLRLNDDLEFSMIDASVNIRISSSERTELYVGPVVARFSFDDLSFEALGEVARLSIDDELGFGLVAGLDVDLGDGGWFFTGRVKYVDVTMDVKDKDDPNDPGVDVDLDPLMVSVGFGVRL